MKSLNGIALLFFSLILTILAWLNAGFSQFLIPGLALTSLSLTFLLSTRAAFLEKLFHGIENMYFFHKIMATFSLLLLVFHNVAMGGLWGSHLAAQLGNIAIYLFFSIILVAYLGKFLKYESWRMIHRLVYLAYIFGLLHAYMILGRVLLQPTFLGFVVGGFALIGLVSGFYIIFLYQRIGFKHKGTIKRIDKLNHDTLDIEIELDRPFDYDYGQFAFVKIFQKGLEKAPHPFSISGGHGNTVYFTVKTSGDHTQQMYDKLAVGTSVKIDRAYGHMKLDQGRSQHIWIAGGIGITPFLSYIRETPTLKKPVDFYYAYTGAENAVHLDLLMDYQANNPLFKLHLLDSKVDGYLDFSNHQIPSNTTIFMCGPTPMMNALATTFKKVNPLAELIYEGFSFK
ncbi:ferredoxin reductase family protein [Streptococcus himalayensis]|uniref:ferredoxin reductase family protein n=1 Tax=Streptococcus himalayensis TaxID=1888195 RepID=UPI00083DC97D|nr:ferric reductase-like transmembrane domain-containing protein [Streptococcus himalayensis]